MARLEVLKFSRDIVSEDEAVDGIPLEITEFPGKIAVTSVGTTVGIFVPDEEIPWAVMSRFQETEGNIIILAPTQDGELTFNGTSFPIGASITLTEQCKIFVRYENGEGGWR